MDEKLHVLHVLGRLNIGGAESRVMDLYRNIDRTKYQFDFMQHTDDVCAFQKEIEELGGTVYHVPRFRFFNIISYCRSWKIFFKKHPEIKIVHGHMTSTAGIYLPIAKKIGNAYTIAHARSAGVDKGIKGVLTRVLRLGLSKKCDQCFSCSELASIAVFGQKAYEKGAVQVIPNAIEVEKFVYDERKRAEIRAQYQISDDMYVIGHVGRFHSAKNHTYMVQIIKECVQKDKKCCLMFVGDGPLKEQVVEYVKSMGMQEHVIFTGNQSNVADYYQAFDCFILPSFYEGLPGTAVEAQVSGLPGIISDRVTSEAIVTDTMKQESIDVEPKYWADRIMGYRGLERKTRIDEVRAAGFDVKEQAQRLSDFYAEAVK